MAAGGGGDTHSGVKTQIRRLSFSGFCVINDDEYDNNDDDDNDDNDDDDDGDDD